MCPRALKFYVSRLSIEIPPEHIISYLPLLCANKFRLIDNCDDPRRARFRRVIPSKLMRETIIMRGCKSFKLWLRGCWIKIWFIWTPLLVLRFGFLLEIELKGGKLPKKGNDCEWNYQENCFPFGQASFSLSSRDYNRRNEMSFKAIDSEMQGKFVSIFRVISLQRIS